VSGKLKNTPEKRVKTGFFQKRKPKHKIFTFLQIDFTEKLIKCQTVIFIFTLQVTKKVLLS